MESTILAAVELLLNWTKADVECLPFIFPALATVMSITGSSLNRRLITSFCDVPGGSPRIAIQLLDEDEPLLNPVEKMHT